MIFILIKKKTQNKISVKIFNLNLSIIKTVI